MLFAAETFIGAAFLLHSYFLFFQTEDHLGSMITSQKHTFTAQSMKAISPVRHVNLQDYINSTYTHTETNTEVYNTLLFLILTVWMVRGNKVYHRKQTALQFK